MDSTCSVCGKDDDLLTAFTKDKVCGKCARKNHSNAVKGKNSHAWYKDRSSKK